MAICTSPVMIDDLILDTAAAWHAQVTADAVDWDAFTRWLQADPRHTRAYDAVALTEALLDDCRPAQACPVAANDDMPVRSRSRLWVPTGAAALLALAATLVLAVLPRPPGHQSWQTGDQATAIAMSDGIRVAIAPRSVLTRDGDRLTLTGDAVFGVPHRPDRTLAITAGELTISDIGTHFDLRNDGGTVRLSVDDGHVTVASPRLAHALTVGSGQALLFEPGTAQIVLAPARAGSTGDWQHGQLSYRDTPLPLVAADIARYGRGPLRVDSTIAQLHFSGTLRLGTGHEPAQDLARLMALDLVRPGGRSGDGAVLRPAGQRHRTRNDAFAPPD
jgi:transmembrane sensor